MAKRNTARAVRILRAATGWSQTEAAYEIGRSPSYMSLVENGLREPSEDTLMSLITAAGISKQSFDDLCWNGSRDTLPKEDR